MKDSYSWMLSFSFMKNHNIIISQYLVAILIFTGVLWQKYCNSPVHQGIIAALINLTIFFSILSLGLDWADSVQPYCKALHSLSKILHYTLYFPLSSCCLKMCPNTVFHVWYITWIGDILVSSFFVELAEKDGQAILLTQYGLSGYISTALHNTWW